jgi:hypothetical protein
MNEPNEIEATGPDTRDEHRDIARNSNSSVERPFGDAGNLYEIPRVRSDDPPMRYWWWSDDEPQQDGSGPQQ